MFSRLFLIAAIVCFVIALLLATDAITGTSQDAWTIGGLLSLSLSFLDWNLVVGYVHRPPAQ